MVQYHPYQLHLTRKHGQELARGGAIQLSPKHLHGGHQVYLTGRQGNAIDRARAGEKPGLLKLSKSQIRYNVKAGGGIGDFLKSVVGKVGRIAVDKLAPLAKGAISAGIGKLAGYAESKGVPSSITGAIASKLQGFAHKQTDHIQAKLDDRLKEKGYGLKKRRRGKGLHAIGGRGLHAIGGRGMKHWKKRQC